MTKLTVKEYDTLRAQLVAIILAGYTAAHANSDPTQLLVWAIVLADGVLAACEIIK